MRSVSPVYRLRPGTSVLENDADLVLRAGAIHRHDITIDKQQSDAALIDALHRLACGEDVSPSDDVVDDLEQLVTMGFVQDVQPVRDGLSHVLVEAAFLSDVGGMGDRVTTLEEMLPAELVDAILLGRRSFGRIFPSRGSRAPDWPSSPPSRSSTGFEHSIVCCAQPASVSPLLWLMSTMSTSQASARRPRDASSASRPRS